LQKLEKIDFYYSNPCKEIHSIKEFNQLVFWFIFYTIQKL
jgi:hypothetical protein